MQIPSLLAQTFSKLKTFNKGKLAQAIDNLHHLFLKLAGKTTANRIIVPRSLCCYRCFDLREVPPSNHRQALQLKISQWCPWREHSTNIVVHHRFAQVWSWQNQPAANKKFKHTVETRYFPMPGADGAQLQLVACGEGYEGQYWQQGVLKESHWWPRRPDQSAWLNFQRSAGLTALSDLPTSAPEKLPQPWGKDYLIEENVLLVSLERYLWLGLPTVFFFLLGWQTSQIYLISQDISSQTQEREELSKKIEPILKIRGGIQEDQQFLNQVVGLWQQARQLTVLDQVITQLPEPATMKLVLWEYQPDQLRFTVRTSNPDPSLFVKVYSELAWGQDVTAEPDPRGNEISVIIRMKTNAGI